MGHIFHPNWNTAYACDTGEFCQKFWSVREFWEVAKKTGNPVVAPMKTRFGIRVYEQGALARMCIWLK